MSPSHTPRSSAPGPAPVQAPVALVTGGAQRIGRAIARELAAAGWRVAVHYRHSSAEAAALVQELGALPAGTDGGRGAASAHGSDQPAARAFGADLADEIQCRALVPQVRRAMGRIDALVNNASLFEHDSAADFSFANMERHWRANTGAPVLLAQALHAAGGQVVVNVLDQKLWNLNPDHLSYTLSKAALEVATRMLAMAFAPRTRVVGVAPGITLTSSEMSAAEFAAAHRMTPLERGSTPEDVARAVRFLVAEAPAVTGTTLVVDGGQHLSAQARDVVFLARASLQHH
ncbi:MAG: SDR family oxidoreductase [Rubrivivax sp.]|nr:SDR family oxidoreductase [Rubrivivax sp.]